jgi:DNA end-binding protein Ku
MARPIARALLSFGLVAIPVEIHSAIEDKTVRFHWLHVKCGSRVRNGFFCPVCQIPLEREDLVRGYEIEKGRYVPVTEAELEALEAEANRNIELREFIPMQKVDPVYFDRAYYLGQGGGDKPYRLLADAMEKKRPRPARRDGFS